MEEATEGEVMGRLPGLGCGLFGGERNVRERRDDEDDAVGGHTDPGFGAEIGRAHV